MSHLNRMLLANATWASETIARYPDFFAKMANGQNPDILWIGCSDSRVSAERITNSQLGELFVHRSIANLILADDIEASSVLEYAVKMLKVSHIIVCGHYHCGGVCAALMPPLDNLPLVNHRIAGLRRLAERHHDELQAITEFEQRADRLSELNVLDQVQRLVTDDIVLQAKPRPSIHGWIFDVRDGNFRRLYDEDVG